MPSRFLAHSSAQQRLLLEACWFLLVARLGLWTLSFTRLMATLHGRSRTARATPQEDIRDTRWAVEASARRLPWSLTCLPQALAAAWMLQRRGHAPALVYGVSQGFAAHAWVELEGVPVVGDRAAGGFTVLARFPAAVGSAAVPGSAA
ncbi:MAG TPA: lasso peptide biosynthesis B2 protein [Bryobacteraceae bacterium]|jgi:hypothetical protein